MNDTQVPQKRLPMVAWIAVALLAVLALAVVDSLHFHSASAQSSTCTAGPGERCPSDDYIRALDSFDSLNEQVKEGIQSNAVKELQRKMDERQGAADRMQNLSMAEAPGYRFDHDKRKWVLPQPVTQVPTPATPTPAQAAPPAPQKK